MYKAKYRVWLVAITALLATACKKDDITPPVDATKLPRTMAEFIRNNYDLSLLNAALQKTGLYDSLAQAGTYTFFAPDNNAFNTIGISSIADINAMNTDSLRHQLYYHLLRNRYFVSSFPLQLGYTYTTATGEPLYISASHPLFGEVVEDRQVFVNGAMVLEGAKRNISLSNGVIHLLRKPLQYNAITVQEYIARDTSLSLFAALMKQCHLWEGLKNNDPVTVFVPGNKVFRRYGLTQDSITRINPDRYQALAFGVYPLLLKARHVFTTDAWQLSGQAYGPDGMFLEDYSLAPAYRYNGNNGTETATVYMYRKTSDGNYGPNTSGPSQINYEGGVSKGGDHLTANGIVHVIDDLLFYPESMKK